MADKEQRVLSVLDSQQPVAARRPAVAPQRGVAPRVLTLVQLLSVCLMAMLVIFWPAGSASLAQSDGGGHEILPDDGGDDGGGGGGGSGSGDGEPTEDGSETDDDGDKGGESPADQAGDPIELPGGHMVECRTDLHVPGRGIDFEWRRCYRSSFGRKSWPEHTIMGANWFLNYAQRIDPKTYGDGYWNAGEPLLWRNGTGGMEEFEQTVELSSYPPGIYEWVSKTSGRLIRAYASGGGQLYTITDIELETPEGLTYGFGIPGYSDRLLSAIHDRNGNSILIDWARDPGTLDSIITSITDTLGRVYFPQYGVIDAKSVIVSISDPWGRQVDYDYVLQDYGLWGMKGDLRAVWLPEITGTSTGNDFSIALGNRKVIRYKYAHGPESNGLQIWYPDGGYHQLIAVEDPEGRFLRNWYGGIRTIINPLAGTAFGGLRIGAQVWGAQDFEQDRTHPDYPKVFCETAANFDPTVVPPGDIYCFQYDELLVKEICDEWEKYWTSRVECEEYDGSEQFPKLLSRVVTVREKDRTGRLKIHRYDWEAKNTPIRTHIITEEADPALIWATWNPMYDQTDPLDGQPGVFTTKYEYDDSQNLIWTQSPGGMTQEIIYDHTAADSLFWNVPRQILENGILMVENLYEDSRFPLPTKIRTPKPGHPTDMVETQMTYDAGGNVLTRTLPSVTRPDLSVVTRQETYEYNTFGQLTRSVDAEGNVTTREYYPTCSPHGADPGCGTGEGGFLHRITFDAEEGAARNADYDGEPSPPAVQATVEYLHDPRGNAILITDPRGILTQREFNQQNQLVSEIRDLGGIEAKSRYFYNGNGMVIHADVEEAYEGSSRWIRTSTTYDNVNTPLTQTAGIVVDDPDEVGVTTTFIYNAERMRVGIARPEGNAVSSVLDARYQPTQVTVGCAYDGTSINCGSGSATSTIVYDADGRRIEETTPLGNKTRYATHLSRAGVALVTIRDLLGHRLITSTQIYLHVSGQDLRAAADKHPIGRLARIVAHLLPDVRLPLQHAPA